MRHIIVLNFPEGLLRSYVRDQADGGDGDLYWLLWKGRTATEQSLPLGGALPQVILGHNTKRRHQPLFKVIPLTIPGNIRGEE